MKTQLEALLMDVDGTLANNEEVHRQAFNTAFAAFGLDWSWGQDLYRELLRVAGGRERIRYFMEQYRSGEAVPGDWDDFIGRLHRSKTKYYTDSLAAGAVDLRPGVKRLVREARAEGLRLAIVTTTSLVNVTALIEHGFGKASTVWFEAIAAGTDVARKKPAPDLYHHALAQLDLAAPQCMAIEDSANGLKSALAAGVVTLVTLNEYTQEDDFSGAAAVLDQLGEPGSPCRMIRGELSPGPYVDTGYLRRLHAHCLEGRA